MYRIDPMRCNGCEKCLEVCPAGAISMENNRANIDPAKCLGCGACADACPLDAIVSEQVPAYHETGERREVPAVISMPNAHVIRRPTTEVLPTSTLRGRLLPLAGSALVWVTRNLLPAAIAAWRESRIGLTDTPATTSAGGATVRRYAISNAATRPRGLHRHRWGRGK